MELPKVKEKLEEVPAVSALLVPFVVIAPNWFSNNPNPLNPLTLASNCQPTTGTMLIGSPTVTFPIANAVNALFALLAGAFCEVFVRNSETCVASMYVAVQEPQNRNVLPEQPDPVKRVCACAAAGAIPRSVASPTYPMSLRMESSEVMRLCQVAEPCLCYELPDSSDRPANYPLRREGLQPATRLNARHMWL